MQRPQRNDELWQINTKVHQILIGHIDAVRRSKVLIGVTGSAYPTWEVIYTPIFKYTKKRKVFWTAWVVKTGGRWFISEGEEI